MWYQGLLVSLFLALSYGDVCDNNIEDAGIYCAYGLQRYHHCNESSRGFYLETTSIHDCPPGTRCICGTDSFCDEGLTTTEQICKPYNIPKPLAENFKMTYSGNKVTTDWDWELWKITSVEEKLEGEHRQDLKQGKVYSRNGDNAELSMKLEDGKVVKYSWNTNSDDNCKKEVVDGLNIYRINFDHFDLTESKKMGQQDLQTWYRKVGRGSWAYEQWFYTWKMLYTPTTDRIVPYHYQEIYHDVDESDLKYTIKKKFNVEIGQEPKDGNWFVLPTFCDM